MKKLILLLLVSNLLFSCFQRVNDGDLGIADKVKLGQELSDSDKTVKFRFLFPDTVYVGKSYTGKILYKSSLDSITTSFDDTVNSRYIVYYMTKSDNINYTPEYLKTITKDTFGAKDNRTIELADIKFTEAGNFYLDGFINDYIIIDTNKRKNENNKVRYIEWVTRATHKVVAIKNNRIPMSKMRIMLVNDSIKIVPK